MAVIIKSIGISSGATAERKRKEKLYGSGAVSRGKEAYNRKFVTGPSEEQITQEEKDKIIGGVKTREQRAAEEIANTRKTEERGIEAARQLGTPDIDPTQTQKPKSLGRSLLEGAAQEYGNIGAPGIMGWGAAKEQAAGFQEDWQKQLGKNLLEAGIGGITAGGLGQAPGILGKLGSKLGDVPAETAFPKLGKGTAGEATQAIIQKNKKEAAKLLGKLEKEGTEALAGKTTQSLEAAAGKQAVKKKVTDVITHTSEAKEILKGEVIQNIVAGLKNPIVVGGIIASSLGMTSWGLWSKGEVLTDLAFTRQKAIDNGDTETADYIGQILEEATDEALWEKMKTLMPYIGLAKWEGKRMEAIRLKNQQLDMSQDKELQKIELRTTEERKKIQSEAIQKARIRAEKEAYGDFATDEPIQK